jgi:hypothetical protein
MREPFLPNEIFFLSNEMIFAFECFFRHFPSYVKRGSEGKEKTEIEENIKFFAYFCQIKQQ